MSIQFPQNDSEAKQAVRGETDYADTPDELPDTSSGTGTSMTKVLERAKARVELETGSNNWYGDNGLSMVLVAYTAMRAKAAVENAFIEDYSLGDQSVTVRNADPETSQQIQQWAEDVRVGMNAANISDDNDLDVRNTSGYIGDSHVHPDERHRHT